MFARYAKLNKDSLRDRALCKQECCFFCFFHLEKNMLRLLCLQMILWNLRKCERERAWCLNHWFSSFSILFNKNISKAMKSALKCFVCFEKIRTFHIFFFFFFLLFSQNDVRRLKTRDCELCSFLIETEVKRT